MTSTIETRPSLVQRFRGLSMEAVGFAVIGGVGFFVNLIVFNVCLRADGLINSAAGVISGAVAIGTNYLGYRFWLYKDRDAASRKREITLFLLFSGIGLLIENGILAFSVHVLGYDSHLSQTIAKNVVGLAAGTVFRFLSYRTWVFKAMPELEDPAAHQPAEQRAEQHPHQPAGVVQQAELLLVAEPSRSLAN